MLFPPRPVKEFTLANGNKIPSIGLGTWQSAPGEVANAVAHALKSGYRHIDAAWCYGNEHEVGQGIKSSGVPRSEIFVTSKCWEIHHVDPEAAVRDSLQQLGLDYLDLYLVHWPLAYEPQPTADGSLPKDIKTTADGKPVVNKALSEDQLPTWRKFESLVKKGLVKNIGISNFNVRKTRYLLEHAEIKPVVNQIEVNFGNPQPDLIDWLQRHNVTVEAYSPLGSTGAKYNNSPAIEEISKKRNVPAATVAVSWLLARGLVVLPKSVTPSRIESNLVTVKLTEEEFNAIEKAATSHPSSRVCDQTEWANWDIFEDKNPENNDAVQSKKD